MKSLALGNKDLKKLLKDKPSPMLKFWQSIGILVAIAIIFGIVFLIIQFIKYAWYF